MACCQRDAPPNPPLRPFPDRLAHSVVLALAALLQLSVECLLYRELRGRNLEVALGMADGSSTFLSPGYATPDAMIVA